MIHLCKTAEKGQNQISKNDASNVVAEEVCDYWISKNVYPNRISWSLVSLRMSKVLGSFYAARCMNKWEILSYSH